MGVLTEAPFALGLRCPPASTIPQRRRCCRTEPPRRRTRIPEPCQAQLSAQMAYPRRVGPSRPKPLSFQPREHRFGEVRRNSAASARRRRPSSAARTPNYPEPPD